jgi:hypothetical protein
VLWRARRAPGARREATAAELERVEIAARGGRLRRPGAAAGRARPGDVGGRGPAALASVRGAQRRRPEPGPRWPAGAGGAAAAARFGELLQRDRADTAAPSRRPAWLPHARGRGHRNYPLREVRALREQADPLPPSGRPRCRGRRGPRPGWTEATRAEVVGIWSPAAQGSRGSRATTARSPVRARSGWPAAPGLRSTAARPRARLRDAELRRRVAVPRVSFESGLVLAARRLLDGAAGRRRGVRRARRPHGAPVAAGVHGGVGDRAQRARQQQCSGRREAPAAPTDSASAAARERHPRAAHRGPRAAGRPRRCACRGSLGRGASVNGRHAQLERGHGSSASRGGTAQ